MSTTIDKPAPTSTRVPLEEPAQAFADATANPPFLYDLGPVKGREVVNATQAGNISKPDVTDEWINVAGGPRGDIAVRVVRPAGASLSPESKYPVALEECYAVAKWLGEGAAGKGLDTSRVAIAGDSCGGNLAAATTLLAKQRGDITFAAQLLLYPVTGADFDDESYTMFADGYWLTRSAMRWFWDQYTNDAVERKLSTVSPRRPPADELRGLPKTLVINAECDVLRDEGESYA